MKIDEDQLSNWTKPGYLNEEERAENTRVSVLNAINNHSVLKGLDIRVFKKGSYANNTNVRQDSDIDIAVELQSLIKLDMPEGVTIDDIPGISRYTGISEKEFKKYVLEALEIEFGKTKINSTGNKVFRIRESEKILNADIIPCTSFRKYFDRVDYIQGIQLILNNPDPVGRVFNNYPDQHYSNGVDKNKETSKRYKSIVRILKNMRNRHFPQKNYPSFMIESLIFNLDNSVFTDNEGWSDILTFLCINAWSYLKSEEPMQSEQRWREVNNYKYLFHDAQKWSRDEAKQFVLDVYELVK